MFQLNKNLIIPATIFSVALVIASWYYLLWLGPLIGTIIFASMVMLALSFLGMVFLSLIERWYTHQEFKASVRANISRHRAEAEFFTLIKDKGQEVITIVMEQLRSGYIYLEDLTEFKMKAIKKNVAVTENLLEAEVQPTKHLMDEIIKAQRIVVTGGMGSGKTTVLRHLAKQKADLGEVRVFDTHASPSKWPIETPAVGIGRNYPEVRQAFDTLIQEMDLRFKDIAADIVQERGHPIITFFADEWTLFPQMIPNMKRTTGILFSESRKASIDFVIAVHELTVGTIGVEGQGNLRDCFDVIVHCNKDVATGTYHTDVQWGWRSKERVAMIPPGPFIDPVQPVDDTPEGAPAETVIIDLEVESYSLPPTPEEKAKIILTYSEMTRGKEPFSWNQLCLRVFGKKGGTYNAKVRDVLSEYGLNYEKYL